MHLSCPRYIDTISSYRLALRFPSAKSKKLITDIDSKFAFHRDSESEFQHVTAIVMVIVLIVYYSVVFLRTAAVSRNLEADLLKSARAAASLAVLYHRFPR